MKRIIPICLFAILTFVACSDDDNKSVPVNQIVSSYLETKYPGAEIRHAEYDNRGLLEVEFIHDSQYKEAYFNSSNEWVYTEWDVAVADLPDEVSAAVASAYPDYYIDDADYIEKPNEVYYKLDIEKGDVEKYIYVTPAGEIVE